MTTVRESAPLRVLITNAFLDQRTGSELYVCDLARELQRLGHAPAVYSPRLGPLAEQLRRMAIPVVDDVDAIGHAPDLIHGQHHLETMTALARFAQTPALFACHGCLPWQETPPRHPRILHYLAVNQAVWERLVHEAGAVPEQITTVLNWVDLARFQPRLPLPEKPRRALVFSNQASEFNFLGCVRDACARRGIALDVAGLASGQVCAVPEAVLGDYDLVFARGRAAIEAIAVGAAVICCDVEGLGEMVGPGNLERLRRNNFGLRVLDRPLDATHVLEQIDRYDAMSAGQASREMRALAGMEPAVEQIVACYRYVLKQWNEGSDHSVHGEPVALSNYLRQLSKLTQKLGDEAHGARHLQVLATGALVQEQAQHRALQQQAEHARDALQQQAVHARDALLAEQETAVQRQAESAEVLRIHAVERGQWQQTQQTQQAREAAIAAGIAQAQAQSRQVSEELSELRGTLTHRLRGRLLAVGAIRRNYLRLAALFRRGTGNATVAADVPADSAVPQVAAGDAQLACVVLSLGAPASLVDAVRSLQGQDTPIEIIVVNSGGGNPLARLRAAGIEVMLIHRAERLYPGAARNLGILATQAPYVAFLADDCLAEPGWARGRLTRHLAGKYAVSSAVTPARPRNLWSWVSYINLFARRMPGVSPAQALHYGVSYQRELFAGHGLFREDLRAGEDSEFNARLAGIAFDWAPEVRAAHRHPTGAISLLVDQFRRGARSAAIWQRLSGRGSRGLVAGNAFRRWSGLLRIAWHAALPGQRAYVLTSAALMPPAVAAYALGALLGAPEPEAPTASAAAPPRLLALLSFHDEAQYLPDYFRNLATQVDGIIALDDGSDDGSGELALAQPALREMIRLPMRRPHHWDEPRNRRLLVQAAIRHGAEWIVVVDADERVECDFRARAEAELVRADADGTLAFRLVMRELWDHPDHFRCDGIWNSKRPLRLFKARPDHEFDDRALHGHWAPLNSMHEQTCREADLIIYHLRMLSEPERQARQAKYQRLDPNNELQAIGYDYLTDGRDLQLQRIAQRRDYQPVGVVLAD